MEIKNVAIVLGDISGYTRFVKMHGASVLHAEQIITELLEAVIDTAHPPLTLNKLEGDAAFLYASLEVNDETLSKDIAQQVCRFFPAFNSKQQALIKAAEGGCPCDACRQIDQLQFKAILHQGPAVFKQIRQFKELAGEAIILAHRLLKNTITANQYLLMTEEFFLLSEGIADQEPEIHTEGYKEIGQVKVMVYYPERRPLEVSVVEPMTRWTGFVEAGRLYSKLFWRRLFKPRREFHHLPSGQRG